MQSWYEQLSAKNKNFLVAAALAAILLALLHQSLFCGKGLLPSDGIFQSLPWSRTTGMTASNPVLGDQFNNFIPQHQFVYDRMMNGSFPLWNPHLNCGVPNLASLQGALFFPIQLVLSPVDPFYASGIAAFLKLFLAGLFTMLYLRLLGGSRAASLLSGIIFSLGGFMIVWLGHPHVNSAMWLPVLLYFIEKEFREPLGQDSRGLSASSARRWAGFAVAYGFMLLGGHPPTAIHVTLFITVYFIFRLTGSVPGKRVRPVLLFGGSMFAGMLLVAPQLLPYLEYYRLSSSSLSSGALNRWETHLSPANMIHFLLPYFSGSPATGFEDIPWRLGLQDIENFNERTGYAGVLTLLLASATIFCGRCKYTVFYALSALCCMAVILGIPPLPSLISRIPVLQNINHTRLLLLVVFALAVLAGLGLDVLRNMESRRRMIILISSFWIAAGLLLVWFGSRIWPSLAGMDGPHRAYVLRQLLMPAGALIVSAAIALRSGNKGAWFVGFCCLAWTACDLLWFASDYNPSISRDRHYPTAPAIEFLKNDRSVFRIMGLGNILEPNTAGVFGLDDARGRDFMTVKRYEELIMGTAGNFFFYSREWNLPPAFPLLNVKYVMTGSPASGKIDNFELVYSKEVAIYRYLPFLERALVVFNYEVCRNPEEILMRIWDKSFQPRKTLLLEEEPHEALQAGWPFLPEGLAKIVSYGTDEVVIHTSLSRPGFLLLLDTWFPGWQATINGKPAKIYRADYNFRAVSLPAGKTVVRFSYKPASLRLGFILFFAGAALIAVVLLRSGRSQKH